MARDGTGQAVLRGAAGFAPLVFELVDLDPGRSLTVRDLILDGDPVTVEEKSGSESAARWDRVAGRLVTVNGKPCVTGGLLLLPYEVADEVLSAITSMGKKLAKELRREAKKEGQALEITDREIREFTFAAGPVSRLITRRWLIDALEWAPAPLLEKRNSDGQPIAIWKVRFPIAGDAAAVAITLDGIDGFERVAPDEHTGAGVSSEYRRTSRQDQTPHDTAWMWKELKLA